MGIRARLATWLSGKKVEAASVTVKIDDRRGWGSLTGRPQDYDAGTIVELYNDALEAWRKNPIAWRIISDHDGLRDR